MLLNIFGPDYVVIFLPTIKLIIISITQIINDVVTFQKERIRKINTIEAIAIIERIIPWKVSSKYRTSIL